MFTLFGVALVATITLAWLTGTLSAEPAEIGERSGLEKEIEDLGWRPLPARQARAFERKHGVRLLYTTKRFELALSPYPLSCDQVSLPDALGALDAVTTELERYEPRFLSAVGLERVLFCRDLKEGDKSYPSMPNVQHTLILDASSSSSFMRRLVHHEVFHFADFADDGLLKEDEAWAHLNEKHFVYGFGGRLERYEGSAAWSEERMGFVSEYAMSALEEDKAELYSFAMSDPKRVSARAEHDLVVSHKLDYLDGQLARLSGAPQLAKLVRSR